jgi:hypothetical protein
MAKVDGPLNSIEASGNYGKQIIFSNSKGINIVKRFFASRDPNTAGQQAQRTLYTNGVNQWNNLTDEQKAYFTEKALTKNLTGFNYFMSIYLKGENPLNYLSLYGVGLYGVSVYR